MLRPGGQLYFCTFAKLIHDEVFDILDKGKWGKYDNWKSHSPFYSHSDPKHGYEELVTEIGFVHCQLFEESVTTYYTDESFNRKLFFHHKQYFNKIGFFLVNDF